MHTASTCREIQSLTELPCLVMAGKLRAASGRGLANGQLNIINQQWIEVFPPLYQISLKLMCGPCSLNSLCPAQLLDWPTFAFVTACVFTGDHLEHERQDKHSKGKCVSSLEVFRWFPGGANFTCLAPVTVLSEHLRLPACPGGSLACGI